MATQRNHLNKISKFNFFFQKLNIFCGYSKELSQKDMALLSINKISFFVQICGYSKEPSQKDMVLLSINKINKLNFFVQMQIIFCGYSKEPSQKDMVLLSINKINKLHSKEPCQKTWFF